MTSVSALLRAVVGRDAAETLGRRRMAILLATLILLILASPIADIVRTTRLIIDVATVGFLLSCLQQVDAHPGLRLPSRLMVLLWLFLSLPLPWSDDVWVTACASATLAALSLSVLWMVGQDLVRADRVDSELLYSAVGAYLLIGVFWAETYEIVSLAVPSAFAGAVGATPNRSALFYFSFTTLTTTGYGDITAINPVVRMWSIFEAIIGTMYNATVIARLVSLYGSRVKPRHER